jgi:hypothetical protein
MLFPFLLEREGLVREVQKYPLIYVFVKRPFANCDGEMEVGVSLYLRKDGSWGVILIEDFRFNIGGEGVVFPDLKPRALSFHVPLIFRLGHVCTISFLHYEVACHLHT